MWFDLKLPIPVIEECKLSSLQLESIVYACQQHMNILADGSRAGFLVGMCTVGMHGYGSPSKVYGAPGMVGADHPLLRLLIIISLVAEGMVHLSFKPFDLIHQSEPQWKSISQKEH